MRRRGLAPPSRRGRGRGRPGFGFVATLGAAVGLVSCGDAPAPVRVVLITIDTLRHDSLAGGHMPRTRAWAERGARFSRFYAATSTTQPTHASMFTGLHPWEHGVTRNGQVLGDSFRTVAEVFADAGFATRAVVASFPVAARFGFAQGFDEFTEEFTAPFYGVARWSGEDVPQQRFFSLADHVTELALGQLEHAREPRQFFWFHYFDPHAPYGISRGGQMSRKDILAATSKGEEATARALAKARSLYDADLQFLDEALARLFARLAEGDAAAATHVVLVSDHGESFGEDGSLGHGYRLSDSQIRVPAVIVSPAVPPGERAGVAGSVDVMATLLALGGVAGEGAAAAASAGSAADAPPGASASAQRGRDLSRPPMTRGRAAADPDPSGTRVVGMRQTFKRAAAVEDRLDGRGYPLDGFLFYAAASEGRVVLGNGRALQEPGPGGLVDLFRSFERLLEDHAAEGTLDPEAKRALEALGYVD